MIKVSAIPDIMLGAPGTQKPHCSISFVEKSGAIVNVSDCVCTSAYYKNRTINIRLTLSGVTRKVRTISIITFNDTSTCV